MLQDSRGYKNCSLTLTLTYLLSCRLTWLGELEGHMYTHNIHTQFAGVSSILGDVTMSRDGHRLMTSRSSVYFGYVTVLNTSPHQRRTSDLQAAWRRRVERTHFLCPRIDLRTPTATFKMLAPPSGRLAVGRISMRLAQSDGRLEIDQRRWYREAAPTSWLWR